MGSQTLEIMRQGFWASFTGGWFFDPHEEIFCNTFHMYLWLCLLLAPFVIYLTAETTVLPLILYPICICVIFSVIKFINYKLHILFDGEELLEERISKKRSRNLPKVTKLSKNEEEQDVEQDIFKFIDPSISQSNITKVDVETPHLSLKEEMDDALKKSDEDNNEMEECPIPEIPDNSTSYTKLVTATTPHIYSQEKACIVDLHHTKLPYKKDELEVQNNAKSCEETEKENDAPVPPEFLTTNDDDNYLIIANEPTVSDFQGTSDPNSNNVKMTGEQFPLNLHKLVESSSGDSSWASSSIFSSEGEAVDVKTNFMPVDASGPQSLIVDSDIGEVKSENTLSTIKKMDEFESETDKTVSLPALETKDNTKRKEQSNRYNSSGARPRMPQNVGFSLPEIEASTMDDNKVSLQLKSEGLSKSDNAFADGKNDNLEFITDDTEIDLSNKTGEIHANRPRRMGAFRASGGDHRPQLRFRHRTNSESPGTSLLQSETEPVKDTSDNRHFAVSHEDTSSGAVHYFQDEYGCWYSYAFGDSGAQPVQSRSFLADGLPDTMSVETIPKRRDSIGSSLSQQDLDPVLRELTSQLSGTPLRWRNHSNPFFTGQFGENKLVIRVEEPTPKKYYMLPIIKSYSVKISFDRLALLAILDRNKNVTQSILSVILATLVALLGYILLSRDYFYDFWLFVMCFVIAKCQFSLLKSVQPDSASPIHGHNNTIVFSRAIYFCITAVLIIGIDEAASLNPVSHTLYGIPLFSRSSLLFAKDLLIAFMLGFPLLFVFGLLPQVNTLTMHVLEQFDIHIFGGSAMTSMLSSFYSIMRSILCVIVLSTICYVPLKLTEDGKEKGQHVMFSVFSGVLMSVSYHLSRSTSNPEIMFLGLKRNFYCTEPPKPNNDAEIDDPLPEKLVETVRTRLVHDGIVCVVVAFVVFAVHVSTVFTSLQPMLSYILFGVTGALGVLIHYVIPQLRKQLPWLLVASPIFKSYEHNLYEWQEHSRIMWFEKMYVWLSIGEKNILYPMVCMSAMTYHADEIVEKFGPLFGAFLITITSLKLLRSCFTNAPRQHIILIWTVLFFNFDYDGYSETFLVDYFVMSIFVDKMLELFLKFKFILTYSAPWQITWGSAFHAFAQPVSLPHCGMLFVQAVVSAFFSSPLNPLLGSAIFITSYMRPIKFWEKDYNTKRVDHSNTRLSSHIESNPGADDNNLNSIFYEHLTRSLQHSLCGDLLLGRWGNFSSGDCFIMASDYLNALVHIIEVGNGYITFQLRGLEFRGTYCQQREVEAITENVNDDKGCCCLNPGHLNNMLSLNAAFSQRWLAWEVAQSKYILEGYSVSDNTATTMFQMFDLRKIFITYYVTSIIFYCVRNKKLKTWLDDSALMDQLNELVSSSFVDLDTIFRPVTDKDYDLGRGGITRHSFCQNYRDWLVCCNRHRGSEDQVKEDGVDSKLVTLCFALSLLGRRLLSTASNNQWNPALKSFLHGLHALFKGDFRVTAAKDEWVFSDPDLALLRMVVAPAVRMALKLHQDHFTCVDEFEDNNVLYDTISQHENQFVICHEGHPAWRQAVLHNKPNLLALRYVMDDGTDDYKIIMLNKRCLNFRVIKVNKECVRGLWAGQLQELIFLRNRNPERGSIQNAKQALRNMINSSCDQPIGYPIYVSPLTTSYTETNPFFSSISIGSVNGRTIRSFFQRMYRSIVDQYAGHCTRSENVEVEIEMTETPHNPPAKPTSSSSRAGKVAVPLKGLNLRTGSYASIPTSSNNSCTSTSSQSETQAVYYPIEGKARLRDITRVTEALNSKIFSELNWTNVSALKDRANMGSWFGWYPRKNMVGDVLYHWVPEHENIERRSHVSKKIYLLKIENYIVPVVEDGIILLDENLHEMEV